MVYKCIYTVFAPHHTTVYVGQTSATSRTLNQVAFDELSELANLVDNGNGPKGDIMAVCPTRWTLRWIALNAFKRRYAQFLEFYANQSDLSIVKGLEEFDNYFCVCMLECLFFHTHSCHIALQILGLSVGDGKTLIKRVKECLERMELRKKLKVSMIEPSLKPVSWAWPCQYYAEAFAVSSEAQPKWKSHLRQSYGSASPIYM